MNFIIFKFDNHKIYIELIPFNQLSNDKTESYNEMDFSAYTTKNIEIPMSVFNYQIFLNTMIYNYKDDSLTKNYQNDNIIFHEKTLTFFELNNDIKGTVDKKAIDLENLISDINTFISKLPIFMKLYKSKSFINENYYRVKFVYFYEYNNGILEDSIKTKDMIKSKIDSKFKDIGININIQIILGSKQIQAINFYELILEYNKKEADLKQELKGIQNRVKNLEEEFEKIKKFLQSKKKKKK
jgi:hypothetical protein